MADAAFIGIRTFGIAGMAGVEMSSTVFPMLPVDVAVLTAREFACDREGNNVPPLEEVRRDFGNDANRALVDAHAFCSAVDSLARVGPNHVTNRG